MSSVTIWYSGLFLIKIAYNGIILYISQRTSVILIFIILHFISTMTDHVF